MRTGCCFSVEHTKVKETDGAPPSQGPHPVGEEKASKETNPVGGRQTHEWTGSVWREVGPRGLEGREGTLSPKEGWEGVTPDLGPLTFL